jgi:hypothetical protein
MSVSLEQRCRPPLNWVSRSNDLLQRSHQYLYSNVAWSLPYFFLMDSRYCLLRSFDQWQWLSGDHVCLWSMTTQKMVWGSSLPLIHDDSDGDPVIKSICHRWWYEGWPVDSVCLWSMRTKTMVWWSSLPLIYDDLLTVSVCDRWEQRRWSGDHLSLWSMMTTMLIWWCYCLW